MDTWRMKHYETLIHACSAWVCEGTQMSLFEGFAAKDTLLNLFSCNVGSCVASRKILTSHAWLGLVWHAEWSGSPPPCKTAPAIKHLPSSFQLPCHPTPLNILNRNGLL